MKKNSKLLKKLKDQKGFSLAELLACTMIMLLATSVLSGTISLATRNYDKQMRISKADILCESLSFTLREKLSYVYRYDSSKDQFYSTGSDLGYYPFEIDLVNVSGDNMKAHDELVLKYFKSDSAYDTFHLVNSASYIGGDYSADYEIVRSISSTSNQFEMRIKIKDTNSGDVLSETDFVVDPFITEVPDIN